MSPSCFPIVGERVCVWEEGGERNIYLGVCGGGVGGERDIDMWGGYIYMYYMFEIECQDSRDARVSHTSQTKGKRKQIKQDEHRESVCV